MEDIKKRISKLVDLKSIISIIMVAAKHSDHKTDRGCGTAGKRVQRFYRKEFCQPSPDLGTQ